LKPRPDSPPQASVLNPLTAWQQITKLDYVAIPHLQTMSPLLLGILLWSSILSGENHQFAHLGTLGGVGFFILTSVLMNAVLIEGGLLLPRCIGGFDVRV
jgi:hypothetical protein